MRRRFVAIGVPTRVRRALDPEVARVRAVRPDLRWVSPLDWHVTLAYLGPLEDTRVAGALATMAAAVRRAPLLPGELRLEGAGRFDDRVLWAGVAQDPAGGTAALGSVLQALLVEGGLPVQVREVVAHVTLARGGRGSRVTRHDRRRAGGAVSSVVDAARRWRPDAIELWSSGPAQGGASHAGRRGVYEVDASVPLGV